MAITCFWGSLGAGKTYSMVDHARVEFKRRLCQVYTDMTTLRFPEQVYLDIENIAELAYVEEGLLLLDEAQIGLASGKWQSVPDEAMRAMAQFRKNGLEVLYTTQHPDRVVKVLRENTHNWVRCRAAGPFVVQVWKTALNDKKGKLKVVPLRSLGFGLYDTYEVLGAKPSRALVRSDALAIARRARSANAERKAADPFKVPIWHASTDGVQQLTVLAREVLAQLKEGGRVIWGTRDTFDYVALECRRRTWLQAFGLAAADVAETTVIEHPWAVGGCKCHRQFQGEDWVIANHVPWAVATVASVAGKDVIRVAGRKFAVDAQGLAGLAEWAGERLADRLGKFQVKGEPA